MGNLLLALSSPHESSTQLILSQEKQYGAAVYSDMLTGISSVCSVQSTLADFRFSFLHHQLHELIVCDVVSENL
jgi:hypothetical protein